MDIGSIELTGLEPEVRSLRNGRNVYLFADANTELVRMDFVFEAGAVYQPQLLVSAVANSLFTEGTLHHTAVQIADFMDARGVAIEHSRDYMTASLTVYVLRKYAEELLPLLHEMMTEPLWSEAEYDVYVSKLKQHILTAEGKTSQVARNLFYAGLYGQNHPYGTYAGVKDVEALTISVVRSFYQERYNLDEMKIILSGAVDEQLLSAVGAEWGTVQGCGCVHRMFCAAPSSDAVSVGHLQKGIEGAVQNTVRVGRLLPLQWQDEELSSFMVLNTVLGGYFGSRLMTNLREDKGYTYGIYSNVYLAYGSLAFFAVADVASEHSAAALKEIRSEMTRLCEEPIGAEELQCVVNYMVGDFLRSIDGVFERAERFKQMYESGIDEQFTRNLLSALSMITPDQLRATAQHYLDPSRMLEVEVGQVG